jgi:hypothetical protein
MAGLVPFACVGRKTVSGEAFRHVLNHYLFFGQARRHWLLPQVWSI